MNVVLVAHSEIKSFSDPSQPQSYDRYQLKLHQKSAAVLREAVKAVLFATYETFVKKDKGQSKARAFGDGKRVIFTERRPSFDAKNRLGLPFEIALSWSDYVTAASVSKPDQTKLIKQDIEELIETVKEPELKALMQKSYQDAGENVDNLKVVLNRIRTRLGG
jgi:hypothetical protein